MLIVYNPTAGGRARSLRARGLWQVVDLLLANGMRLDLAETRSPGHAAMLAREAVRGGAEQVVAAGGDGTIAEVASGLLGSTARLGIIPLGTANVLARELALSFAPYPIAAALAFGRTCRLWPGLARSEGLGEAARERLFVQMLGVGFDAQVVHRLSLPLKRAIGRGAYVLQGFREMARYAYPAIRMRVDGVSVEAGSAIISKGRLYAGPYTLAPDATPGEPGFCVALFEHGGAAATLMYGAALPLNRLHRVPGLRLLRARCIELLDSPGIPAQADGDPAGHTPLSVTDAPEPLSVVIG